MVSILANFEKSIFYDVIVRRLGGGASSRAKLSKSRYFPKLIEIDTVQ